MISEDEVSRVAHLARLSLTGDEVKRLSQQLSLVLQHFENVSKVDTKGIEPLVTPTDIEEFWREDRTVQTEDAVASAMQNAPENVGNLFKVPPVVG